MRTLRLTHDLLFVLFQLGVKAAMPYISMAKVTTPRMAQRVIDRAIQVHGAAGLSQDFHLAMYVLLFCFNLVNYDIACADATFTGHMHGLVRFALLTVLMRFICW